MKSLCKKCKLLEIQAITHKHFIKPSYVFCNDCIRVEKLLNVPENLLKDKKPGRRTIVKNSVEEFSKFVANEPDYHEKRKQIKEERLAYKRKYFSTSEGRAAYRLGSVTRRCRNKNAVIELSPEEKKSIKEFYKNRPDGHDVDHIIPISKGGKHCLVNLRYISSHENRMKKNKIYIEVLEKFLDDEPLSISFLQRKFRMSYEEAKKILEEIGKI